MFVGNRRTGPRKFLFVDMGLWAEETRSKIVFVIWEGQVEFRVGIVVVGFEEDEMVGHLLQKWDCPGELGYSIAADFAQMLA